MGERKDGREIIDRATDRMVEAGLPPEFARKKATEARLRNEQRNEERRRRGE